MSTFFLVTSGINYEGSTLHHTSITFESAVAQAHIVRTGLAGEHSDWVEIRAISPGPGPGVTVARWVSRWEDSEIDAAWVHGPLSVEDEEALVSGRCDWPMGWHIENRQEWRRTL